MRKADANLLCRTLGHAWFPIAAEKVAKYGEPMWLRCERCATERHDDIGRGSGELHARSYVYADGYRHAFDEQFDVTPHRSDFRMLLLNEYILKSERKVRRAS